MTTVVIAGTGLSGLACATHLPADIDCLLVERLPVAGGEHWQEPRVRELVHAATRHGARIAAGTQAVRWNGTHVLLLGAENDLHPADALVVATGHRPMTLGELGVAGDRCGGVVPATVAQHLINHGVTLGHHPVVIGAGRQAAVIIEQLTYGASQVHAVLPDHRQRQPELRTPHQYPGARPVAVHGSPRVASLDIQWPEGRRLRLPCDALILAHRHLPYRNIDGAIHDSPGVVFAQSGQPEPEVAEACGAAAAQEVMAAIAHPRTQRPIPPRIGVPA